MRMTARRRLAKIRRRSAQAAWRAALGNVSGSIPGQYCRSMVEAGYRQEIRKHLLEFDVLTCAHVEHYELDGSLPAHYRRSKAFDDRHIYRLRDVYVDPQTGLSWLPEGPILGESYGSLIRVLGSAALDGPVARTRETVADVAVLLPADGYFHWLLEALPATLHALARAPEAALIVPSTAPRYLDDAVRMLGVERVVRTDGPVRVEELVLAARHAYSGFVPREDVQILRQSFLPKMTEARGGSSLNIYVSRRLAARSPFNEAALEEALYRKGVSSVHPERLSLEEQIELFSSAECVIGPCGAGLANLVWSSASFVGEVFSVPPTSSSLLFNDCHARLAASRGMKYKSFACRRLPGTWGLLPIEEIVEEASRNTSLSRGPRSAR